MGKKKPAPPPPIDYNAQAQAQGAANTTAAQNTAGLSNPNIYGPYGNQETTWDATGPNGSLQPTVRQSLTPEAQAALTAQQQYQAQSAQLGQQGMNRVAGILNTPFQYNGPDIQTSFDRGPGAQTSLGDYGSVLNDLDLSGIAAMPINAGQTAQAAIMSRLQPQLARQEESERQRMANQGLTVGGEAYNAERTLADQAKTDLYTQAGAAGLSLDMQANNQGFQQALARGGFQNDAQNQRYAQALGAGGFYNQGLAQNFNQNMSAAQFANSAGDQSLQRQLALRNQPLNELSAMMAGSQIQAPQFQQYSGTTIGAAPIFDAAQAQGKYNTGIYGQQMAGYNADMSALGQLGGSAMGMFKFSDARLKSNITRVGTHPLGIGIYDYDIFGRRERGVLAHEVEAVRPSAVAIHSSGFKVVNYGAL